MRSTIKTGILLSFGLFLLIQSCSDVGGKFRDESSSSAVTTPGTMYEGADKEVASSESSWLNQRSGSVNLDDQDTLFFKRLPGESADSNVDSGDSDIGTIAPSGFASAVENWLIPSAWAQDHGLDTKYLVRNGNIEMEIKDYEASYLEVFNISQRYNGMITDSQMEKFGDDTRVGWITVRIPGEKFQDAYNDLKKLGDVRNQSITSEDVSNQYITGISRMKILKQEQETLQGMLDDAREIQKTKGLGEAYKTLLSTQSKLSEITMQLQNTEDRVNALADRITRSTIRVGLSERPIAPAPDEFAWGFGSTFEKAKTDLMIGIDANGRVLVYWLVNGLIWWMIWIGIFWFIWKVKGRELYRKIIKSSLSHDLKKPLKSDATGKTS